MARPLRIQAPDLTYHVTARGNAKMMIYADDDDRQQFMTFLMKMCDRHRVRVQTYCQMSNHYHLVFKTELPNLSSAMKQLNGDYARYFNWRHGRSGHLFQGRFNAQVVEEEGYLRDVCRYVALNPVRGGLVSSPELWPWSGHRSLAGIDPEPPFLSSEFLRTEFLERDLRIARARYTEFVNAPPELAYASMVGALERDERVIGSPGFVGGFRDALAAASCEVPCRERFLGRPSLDVLLDGTPARAQLNARMLRAHEAYGYTLGEIASFVGVSRSSVSARLSDARTSSMQPT